MKKEQVECLNKEDYVSCYDCGVLLRKSRACEVIDCTGVRVYRGDEKPDENDEEILYYCKQHEKLYDKVEKGYEPGSQRYYKRQDEWKQVDENGKDTKK